MAGYEFLLEKIYNDREIESRTTKDISLSDLKKLYQNRWIKHIHFLSVKNGCSTSLQGTDRKNP